MELRPSRATPTCWISLAIPSAQISWITAIVDSHHANLKLDYDAERIAEHFTLVACNENWNLLPNDENRRKADVENEPFKGWCLRTAISLFTHKFRTEVPGELMNLLNVRFYLYERAIFNPTKMRCRGYARNRTSADRLAQFRE